MEWKPTKGSIILFHAQTGNYYPLTFYRNNAFEHVKELEMKYVFEIKGDRFLGEWKMFVQFFS